MLAVPRMTFPHVDSYALILLKVRRPTFCDNEHLYDCTEMVVRELPFVHVLSGVLSWGKCCITGDRLKSTILTGGKTS